jgi:hypothetical protein
MLQVRYKRCCWVDTHYNHSCEYDTVNTFCKRHAALYQKTNLNVLYEKDNLNSKSVVFYDKSSNKTIKYNYFRNSWINVFNSEDMNKLTYVSGRFQKLKWITMYLVFKHYMHGEACDIWHNMVYYYIRR